MKVLPTLFTLASSAAIAISSLSGYCVLCAASARPALQSVPSAAAPAPAGAVEPSWASYAAERRPALPLRSARAVPDEAAARRRARARALDETMDGRAAALVGEARRALETGSGGTPETYAAWGRTLQRGRSR